MERCLAILVVLRVSARVEGLTMCVSEFEIGAPDSRTTRVVTIITTLSLISAVTFCRRNSD